MNFKESLKKIRDGYVKHQVESAKLPDFPEDDLVRYRMVFSGRVQKVGFRLEVCEMAGRLGITGYCQNLQNGDVLAEFQWPKNRITYLVRFMESLKRIKVTDKKMEKIGLKGEKGFVRRDS